MTEEPQASLINVENLPMDMAEDEFDNPIHFTRIKDAAFSSEVPEEQLLSALDNLSLGVHGLSKVLENIQVQQGDLQIRVEKQESKDNRGKPGKTSKYSTVRQNATDAMSVNKTMPVNVLAQHPFLTIRDTKGTKYRRPGTRLKLGEKNVERH